MKKIVILLFFLAASNSFAKSKQYVYKHWKTFRSDYGYEFKYPSCWKVRGNSPDEAEIPDQKSQNVAAIENVSCERTRFDPDVPNGISFSAGWGQNLSDSAVKEKIKHYKAAAENNLARSVWKYFKQIVTPNGGVGAIYVEYHKEVGYSFIRWTMNLFCNGNQIQISGPSIKNPNQSYYAKFRSGNLALPEPEKTIYASVRCIPPKNSKRPKRRR